jgi:hypothetical protein
MVADDPESFADLDGHDCCDWDDVANAITFVAGFVNAVSSNNGVAPREDPQGNQTFASGQIAGDVTTFVQGLTEIGVGAGGEVGGLALDATGVGAVAGVPANVVSAGVIAHGGLVTINSGKNLLEDARESTRHEAINDAKRDAGVPTPQQPEKQENVPLTDQNGSRVVQDGKPQTTREYTHTNGKGEKVIIQDHSQGHTFNDGTKIGPHVNVRPPNNTRTGSVEGTKPHYPYKKKD